MTTTTNTITLSEYQAAALTTALPTSLNLPYMALGLAGEAGEVANKAKKLIRDREKLSPEDTKAMEQAIVAELGDVLWYIAGIASVLRQDLSDTAASNLAKLKARQVAGKLHGSGDNR